MSTPNYLGLYSTHLSLTQAGAEYKTNCPFHEDHDPSFFVNPDTGLWHCFGCGKGGNVFQFLMEYLNIDFSEAVRIAKRWGIEPETKEGGQTQRPMSDKEIIRNVVMAVEGIPEEEKKEEKEEKEKQTQADKLYRLGLEADLFLDQFGISWATFKVGDHFETRQLRRKGFKAWLLGRYFETEGKILTNSQALQSCIDTLEYEARKKPRQKVYTRIAHIEDKIYIDLADEEWNIIEVSKDGWRVIRGNHEVKFKRVEGMEPLPIPEEDPEGLELLCKYLNFSDDTGPQDLILLFSFIVGCYSEGPYPILVLQGEQGAGKSTLSRLIKKVVDPNIADLKTLPESERDLMVFAVNNYLLAFDNLAGITPKIGDCLSRLATGGGMSLRMLYTDDEEAILDAKRPIILNGIDVGIERHDLLDRAILVQLPRLKEEERVDERVFWGEFYKDRPRIFGGILSIISEGLKNLENVKLESLPRMADFSKWVVACEPKLPWASGEFLKVYRENREEIIESVLEVDPVANFIKTLLLTREEWVGTPTELFTAFKRVVGETRDRTLPSSPKGLTLRLKRSITFLRQEGIEVSFARDTGSDRKRLIYICKIK